MVEALHGRSATAVTAAVIAAIAAGAATPTCAQSDVAAFYKGRTVEVVIGSPPGGGYDLYGRLVARWLGKHIPGEPNVVVRNMPGAGHLRMTNWLYNVAPRDGTVLATAPQALAIEQALGSEGIQYDAAKFTYIGRAAPVVEVSYVWHTSPTKTLDDARKRETVMGGSGPTSPTVFYLRFLNAFAGTKFKIISGFTGVSETDLAVQRGEIEGATKSWASMRIDNADLLREKKVNVILQFALDRAPDLPNVPLASELGNTDEGRAALKLFATGNAIGRALMATPGIPPERTAALRKAFLDTMNDPELVAFARERNIDIGPLDGEGLQAIVDGTLNVSRDVIAQVKKARGDQ